MNSEVMKKKEIERNILTATNLLNTDNLERKLPPDARQEAEKRLSDLVRQRNVMASTPKPTEQGQMKETEAVAVTTQEKVTATNVKGNIFRYSQPAPPKLSEPTLEKPRGGIVVYASLG